MIRLRAVFTAYHPIVWWILAGTMLTRFTSFMVMPFMTLYMKSHTHASTGTIGLVVGCAALMGMVFGLFGGSLADRFGRKRLMVIAMVLNVLVMAGYANARAIPLFFLLSIGTGLTRALFQPASQAMLADITTPDKRATVFALRYWAINMGAAFGPIIGGFVGTVATGWTFYLAAFTNLLYLLVIIWVIPNRSPTAAATAASFSFTRTLKTIAYDRALLLFLVAAFLSNIGYSQIDSTLPQRMALTMDPVRAAMLFGIVTSSNAIEVVFLQLPISKIAKRMGLIPSMMLGQGIFAVGYICMGYATGLWSYVLAMFVITIGEIIVFPQNSQYLSELAHEEMRASYFGAWTTASLGLFVGPWLGGLLLPRLGGHTLFVIIGVIVAAGAPFYRWSNERRARVSQDSSMAL